MKSTLRYIMLISSLLILSLTLKAQQTALVTSPVLKKEKFKPVKNEISFGIQINSNGYGIFAERATMKSEDEKRSDMFYDAGFFSLAINEVKHSMEYRRNVNSAMANVSDITPTPYIYGKANKFYNVKMGYGIRKMITGKPQSENISVHYVLNGGISIGLQKPYYLTAFSLNRSTNMYEVKDIKYTDSTRDDFMNTNHVIGRAPFIKGINELKVIPGLHMKTGFHFDFAGIRTRKLAIELGAAADFYFSKVELMADKKGQSFLVNGYLAFQFGKRYLAH